MSLPVHFKHITASKNKVLQRLALLRTDKQTRLKEGHVLVQGLKTIEELANKGHVFRTIGITFDENNLPIRSPALEVVRQSLQDHDPGENNSKTKFQSTLSTSTSTAKGRGPKLQANHYVATSRLATTRILGTDSPVAEHEVWAEVRIPDHRHFFSLNICPDQDLSTSSTATTTAQQDSISGKPSTSKTIERMLVLDRITDPGNMGLMIRAAKALDWDASWHTPGTVDQYNSKVVRASRALCLDWPSRTADQGPLSRPLNKTRVMSSMLAPAGWTELELFLAQRRMTLVVADMLPTGISGRLAQTFLKEPSLRSSESQRGSQSEDSRATVNPYELVWWNWPASLSQRQVPSRIALVLSSEHHGVKSRQQDEQDQEAKRRLFERAIRVSIPMRPEVESMNVSTAATTMMWELNKLIARHDLIPQIIDTE
ncbi:hypothetical protein BGW38_002772 [Lunasporangiospora selenospora]|uniref:tRNA/rRNA methyltransferase SpoU type domain-containing protein n=1 Tax=Lunasporangiospora selenospora TaxID=979761 RepID=A0A9P6G438_9FUNG|nr:hypothetical protein BGW38_002772 [Lunasporangiospora selenospora]